jgi:hypothetical protein
MPQQSRFAGAVNADDTYLVAFLDIKSNAAEQSTVAVTMRQVFYT